jgi:Fic family protein
MRTRKPDTTRGFHPRIPGTPDTVQPALSALRLDGGLDRSVLSPQLHQVLLGVARLRNAVSSFRLEGERVHLDRARDVLETGRPETNVERGILQLARAYRDVSAGKLPEFSLAGIERAHRELFAGVLDDALVGRYKTSANVITDVSETVVRFEPTPPERVRGELAALLAWLAEATGAGLPPVTAAIFFAEFEAIHPFPDGNGRLGRYLNVALLHKLGLRNSALIPLDTRFFRTSDRYYAALASTNTGKAYHLWTRYYARELHKAYEVAVGRGDLRGTLEQFSRRSTQSVLLWVLSGAGQWFHRGDYPNPRGYSGPAVWGALQELVRAGLLEERGAAKGREYRLKSGFLADVYGRMA